LRGYVCVAKCVNCGRIFSNDAVFVCEGEMK
jgi:hypothetical protein